MGDPAIPRALRSNTTLQNPPRSAYKTFLDIRTAIFASAESRDLAFDNIPLSTGSVVFDALVEDPNIEDLMPRMTYNSYTNTILVRVRPTKVHDIPQMWLTKELGEMREVNFLSRTERAHFDSTVGTRPQLTMAAFEGFVAPYAGSRKEPDWALIPNTDNLPSMVAELGWSDSWPKLIAGMELWLQGAQPNIQLVLLFNWSKRANNSVAGEVRVYERTAAGNTNQRLRASIFPVTQGGPAGIPVTRGEIFGVSGVFPGTNAADIWHLSLTRLRETADRCIRALGFVPA